jgi:hypothetical protein
VAFTAAASGPSASAAEERSLVERTLFVNMFDDRYTIGRFVDGRPSPVGPVAVPQGCHLWNPSVVRARGRHWLYVAEHDCVGWHRVVLYTSRNGADFQRVGVVLRTREQLRMPAVIFDRGTFHLWFSRDGDGKFASEIVHAVSRDGRRFVVRGVRFTSSALEALSPAEVFRHGRYWWMFIEGYADGLTTARPYLLRFRDPSQARYQYVGAVEIDRPVPKIDASFVCRASAGWKGIFTGYGAGGAKFGHEWTIAYEAPRLLGPWRLTPAGAKPVLPLWNGTPKTSVENATTVTTGRAAVRC